MNVIHPGLVKSRNDGQIHFVSFVQLVHVYGLEGQDNVKYNKHTTYPDDAMHYGVRWRGDYATHGEHVRSQHVQHTDASEGAGTGGKPGLSVASLRRPRMR